MAGWLFILIVLGVGVGLALYVDRLKSRPGSGESPRMGERSRWLHFWYTGRFPDGEGTPPNERDERK